jgi:hypothetical protein
MAAELQTPIDEYSGLPLPIAPSNEQPLNESGAVFNLHHAWHPKADLQGSLGARALRSSRIQLVDETVHNNGDNAYHNDFNGPQLPQDELTRLNLIVFSCAGYVPEQGIDMTSNDPTRPVLLTSQQQAMLKIRAEPRIPEQREVERYIDKYQPDLDSASAFKVLMERNKFQALHRYQHWSYGYDLVRTFMATMVLDQNLGDVKRRLLHDFTERGQDEAGMKLLGIAANKVVLSELSNGRTMHQIYRQAHEDSRLHPMMPPTAKAFILYKLGNNMTRFALLPELRVQLMASELAAA